MRRTAGFDRRAVLAGAGAAALAAGLPATAQTAGAKPEPKLAALLDRLVETELSRDPQYATSLGLDVGARSALRGKIEDRSLTARDAAATEDAKALADLKAIDRERLSAADRVAYDTVDFQLTERQRQAKYPYGGEYTAYTLTQRSGVYSDVPDFLENRHPLETAADAEACVSRLAGYAVALDQETERFLAEAEAGAIPPAFILDTTLSQLKTQRSVAPADFGVVRKLANRAAEKGLPPRHADAASDVFATKVVPALDRQITAVDRIRQRATTDAGVWKLPDGEAYYAAKLKWFTTTDLTPEEVHQLGLEQVRDLTGRIDAVLKSQGLTQGSVLQRLQALNVDPAQLHPNDDTGREALLASLNAQIVELDRRLPSVFSRLPRAKVEVRRVPVDIQDGAANGYYQSPSVDGTRPGAFYINLKSTTDWPKWSLPTLTYHEASPGHHLQNALVLEDPGIPLYMRAFSGNSAYGEGWALYAEQVADELGLYEAYPLGRVGMLKAYLFRAARLAVDTGIHHKRWTREQANRWIVEAVGDPAPKLAREVDRYCTNPGQACSYKIGQTRILALREATRARLGPRFDIKRFHDAVLGVGEVPITVLERAVAERLA